MKKISGQWQKKYHLSGLSGGSRDFHGANKPYIHLGTGKGTMSVPHEFLEAMRKLLLQSDMRSVECSDSEKNMSAYADQNHAPSLTCVRLEYQGKTLQSPLPRRLRYYRAL